MTTSGWSAERWRAVSPHLDHALELNEGDRATWLAALRTTDPTLAADIEVLLRDHEVLQAKAFLTGTAPGPPRPSLAWQEIGAYILEVPIGDGGMGSVWKARRNDGRFEGVVAVKLLNTSLLGGDGEARFEREGRILARLRHPHIAHLLDAGVFQGRPYLVLEHVDGMPIDAYADSRRLSVDARIRLFLDVLSAVAHAHASLIVHRDLKPANILVTEEGRVKLLDFGIAKLLQRDEASGAVTREGQVRLTPQYAAPEQLTSRHVTVGTDVYALGVLLYLLLSGRHPAGPAASSAEVVRAVLEVEPPPVSAAAGGETVEAAARRSVTPRRLCRTLEGDLDAIVAQALKKDPAERYPSASAFADDLLRWLRHEPVSARPSCVFYRSRKFVRRHRLAVGLGLAALLGTTVAGGVAVDQMLEARRQRDAAFLEARKARASGELARFVLSDEAGSDVDAVRRRLDRARKLLQGTLIDDPRVRSHLLLELVPRYMELGDLQVPQALIAEVRGGAPDDPSLKAAVACVQAFLHLDAGRGAEAALEIREGFRVLAAAPRTENQPWPECLLADSYRLTWAGRGTEAMTQAAAAGDWLAQNGLRHTSNYADARHTLAVAAYGVGRYRDALLAIREATALGRAVRPDESTSLTVSQQVEAAILKDGGKVQEAAALIDSVVTRLAPSDGKVPSFVRITQGRIRGQLGRYDAAIPLLERAMEDSRAEGRENDRRNGTAYLVMALTDAGRLEEARRRLDGFREGGPLAGNQALWLGLANARLLAARKELAAAENALREAADSLPSTGAPHPRRRELAAAAAEIALRKGETAIACEAAGDAFALATQQAIDPASSAWVGEALLLRAQCGRARGDGGAARADATAALPHVEPNLGPEHPLSRRARELAAPE